MMIIGCDYHPGFQRIACIDTETGELNEHSRTGRKRSSSNASSEHKG
jgi:hypothetical protein